ncbi:MAG: GspH/FimT family protein, partial [Thiolinea sp.]
RTLIDNNRSRALADEFVTSLYRTRSEAAKLGFDVVMCASNAAQSACDDTATDFSKGWLIFADYDQDRAMAPAGTTFDVMATPTIPGDDLQEEILYRGTAVPDGFWLGTDSTGDMARRIVYDSNGTPKGIGLGVSYSLEKDEEQRARMVISITGRVRTCIGDAVKCN